MFGQHTINDQVKDIEHSIRGMGNESLHPGQISEQIDREDVLFVFELINLVTEETITKKIKMNNFVSKYKTR